MKLDIGWGMQQMRQSECKILESLEDKKEDMFIWDGCRCSAGWDTNGWGVLRRWGAGVRVWRALLGRRSTLLPTRGTTWWVSNNYRLTIRHMKTVGLRLVRSREWIRNLQWNQKIELSVLRIKRERQVRVWVCIAENMLLHLWVQCVNSVRFIPKCCFLPVYPDILDWVNVRLWLSWLVIESYTVA